MALVNIFKTLGKVCLYTDLSVSTIDVFLDSHPCVFPQGVYLNTATYNVYLYNQIQLTLNKILTFLVNKINTFTPQIPEIAFLEA